MHEDSDQEIVGCTPTNLPRHGKSLLLSPILWVFMGKLSPQKSLENRINTYKSGQSIIFHQPRFP